VIHDGILGHTEYRHVSLVNLYLHTYKSQQQAQGELMWKWPISK